MGVVQIGNGNWKYSLVSDWQRSLRSSLTQPVVNPDVGLQI